MDDNRQHTSSTKYERAKMIYPKDPEALEHFGQPVMGPPMEVDPATGKLRRKQLAKTPESPNGQTPTTTPDGKTPFSAQPTTIK